MKRRPDSGGLGFPVLRVAPLPLLVVADHPEAAHDAVVGEKAPVDGAGDDTEGAAVGADGGDRRPVVAGETAEDLHDLLAVVENVEATGPQPAGRRDAALRMGGECPFVEVDPA